jgi:hypothetical protein
VWRVNDLNAKFSRLKDHTHDELMQIEKDCFDTIHKIKIKAATERTISVPMLYAQELPKL